MGWVGGDSWKGAAGAEREVGFAWTGSREERRRELIWGIGGPRASDNNLAGGIEESRADAIRLGFGRVVFILGWDFTGLQ
jgi:hypothetical protein